jgi:hypothetical protein
MLKKLLSVPMRYKPWRPLHLRLIAADLGGGAKQASRDNETHLAAAIGWLCRAQDIRDNGPDAGGVSAGWSYEDGWLPSYPETSGYIVETFLAASRVLGRSELVDRAVRILDWELSIQNADGSFPGHFGEAGSSPVIFNTAQIMHGMVAGFHELGRSECLEAAVRAGCWMITKQDPDGCWRRSVHNGVPHTYNTRSAWALLRTGLLSGEQRLVDAAVLNLEWALSQVTTSGWFKQNAFKTGEVPFTHTIAYAMRGLLEGGVLVQQPRFIQATAVAAGALAEAQREDGWLTGAFDDNWRAVGRYSCLTGVAQVALNWQRLRQLGVDGDWQTPIDRAVSFLKRNHRMAGEKDPTDGGVAGSTPIWGRYSRFEYPNWAAKFFIDLLLMEMSEEIVPRVASGHYQPLSEKADV